MFQNYLGENHLILSMRSRVKDLFLVIHCCFWKKTKIKHLSLPNNSPSPRERKISCFHEEKGTYSATPLKMFWGKNCKTFVFPNFFPQKYFFFFPPKIVSLLKLCLFFCPTHKKHFFFCLLKFYFFFFLQNGLRNLGSWLSRWMIILKFSLIARKRYFDNKLFEEQ